MLWSSLTLGMRQSSWPAKPAAFNAATHSKIVGPSGGMSSSNWAAMHGPLAPQSASVPHSAPPVEHTPAEPHQELHVCMECYSELVYPVHWDEAGPENWNVLLHCPNCDVYREGVFAQDTVESFDEELDRGGDALARDYKRLMRANMAEEIDRFVGALQADAILPEDF